MKLNFVSPTWVCFLAFPFTIGFKYPFPSLVSEFFTLTGLSYAQIIPEMWRIF
ncbi:hypothetical protein Hanom_Chr17g01549161 [Helianthus anomalus]